MYRFHCRKLKSKSIKDLNINPITLNLIEEKVRCSLEHVGTGHYFLNITLVAQTLRSPINKWDLLKLKSFCKLRTLSVRQNFSVQNRKDLYQPYMKQKANL